MLLLTNNCFAAQVDHIAKMAELQFQMDLMVEKKEMEDMQAVIEEQNNANKAEAEHKRYMMEQVGGAFMIFASRLFADMCTLVMSGPQDSRSTNATTSASRTRSFEYDGTHNRCCCCQCGRCDRHGRS